MRTILIAFALLLAATAGYLYLNNPAGCAKLGTDLLAVFHLPPATPVAADQTAVPPTAPAPVAAVPAAKPAPVPAPSPAPAQNSAPVAVNPLPSAVKPWAPPDLMPSQPNWTWETSDGKTYQNVVVTKIEPEMVSITHSMGVAHISISTLPPEIQKQLNYDPVVAAAAVAEAQREAAHPYYSFASRAEAQAVARQMHWPLAWLASQLDYSTADPQLNPWADLTQMALSDLKSHAIIIFIDNNGELGDLPAPVRDQLFILDDGPIPGGHHFEAPKIVLSNPDATKIFGRASFTQMKADGVGPIDKVLQSIANDPVDQALLNGQTASASAPPSSPPATIPVPAAPPEAPVTTLTASASAPAPAANPSPDAAKPWAPPDIMPSQPNWTWETSDGKTYQNVVVTKIEPDTVSITHAMGVAHISISLLPPEIQKQLNYDPQAASQIAALIDAKLVSADGTAASTPSASVQYYAIYYSAQWCPPCHHFTPELVQWYNKFKPSHSNFELIFVSEDHNRDSMLAYMKEMTMPWPAFQFDALKHDGVGTFRSSGIEKFAGDGIPDLVLVNASGKVLSDSYRDGTYVGPEEVMTDIGNLVTP